MSCIKYMYTHKLNYYPDFRGMARKTKLRRIVSPQSSTVPKAKPKTASVEDQNSESVGYAKHYHRNEPWKMTEKWPECSRNLAGALLKLARNTAGAPPKDGGRSFRAP